MQYISFRLKINYFTVVFQYPGPPTLEFKQDTAVTTDIKYWKLWDDILNYKEKKTVYMLYEKQLKIIQASMLI